MTGIEAAKRARVVEPKELALELKVAHSTITRAIRAGRIRAIQVGASYRIPLDEAERVIAEGIPPAAQEAGAA